MSIKSRVIVLSITLAIFIVSGGSGLFFAFERHSIPLTIASMLILIGAWASLAWIMDIVDDR